MESRTDLVAVIARGGAARAGQLVLFPEEDPPAVRDLRFRTVEQLGATFGTLTRFACPVCELEAVACANGLSGSWAFACRHCGAYDHGAFTASDVEGKER